MEENSSIVNPELERLRGTVDSFKADVNMIDSMFFIVSGKSIAVLLRSRKGIITDGPARCVHSLSPHS